MTEVYLNYVAVVVAAVANMAVGTAWFGPLFGKQWIAMMGFTQQHIDAAKAKGDMWKTYLIAFVGSLAMAYVLSHLITFASSYMDVSGIQVGWSSAFWAWLGFVAPVTLSSVLWEGKSWKLWALTSAYYLVSLLVMGSILAWWM